MTGRPALAALAALAAALGLGCFVAEELDRGEKLMENPSFSEPAKAAPPSASKARQAEPPRDPAAWWRGDLHSVDPRELDADVVRCDLAGSTSFMSRSDCLARGGRAGSPAR